MIHHSNISDNELRKRIKSNEILFGGNIKLKIYGRLKCTSGKRIKKENRTFFASKKEAIQQGFRPCAHCMRNEYKNWKNGLF